MHLSVRLPRSTTWAPLTGLRPAGYMLLASACLAAVETIGGSFISGMSIVQLVWCRYAVHLMFMLVVLAPRRGTAIVRSRHLGLQVLRSMTMLVMPLAFVLAVRDMPPNDVWSAYWLSPLTMLVLGVAVLHERVGPVRWIAGGVGLLAAALIEQPDRGLLTVALLPAIGVGAAISVHLLLSRVLRDDDPLASLFHSALWVFAVISLAVPFVWDPPTPRELLGIGFVGLAGMACLYLLARAGETAPLPVVASFAYTELIWLLVFNVAIYHLEPDRWAAAGALIIVALALFMLVYEHRSATRATPRQRSVPASARIGRR